MSVFVSFCLCVCARLFARLCGFMNVDECFFNMCGICVKWENEKERKKERNKEIERERKREREGEF